MFIPPKMRDDDGDDNGRGFCGDFNDCNDYNGCKDVSEIK